MGPVTPILQHLAESREAASAKWPGVEAHPNFVESPVGDEPCVLSSDLTC